VGGFSPISDERVKKGKHWGERTSALKGGSGNEAGDGPRRAKVQKFEATE